MADEATKPIYNESRVMVKGILNKYDYPPDLQEEAMKAVLQQTELLCTEWV